MIPLPLVAALVSFVAVALLIYAIAAMAGGDRRLVAERLKRHSGAVAAAAAGPSSHGTSALLLEKDYSSFDSLNQMLKRSSRVERIAADLTRAAVPLRVGEYLLLRWVAAIGLYAIGTVILHLNLAVCLVLGVLGFYLPRFYVSYQEGRRVRKFEDQLVDALTMMANSLKSGSSFLQAIDLVSREQPAPICQEFARVVAEANVGSSVESSLLDLAGRVRSYDLYLIVTAMIVQREVGGNLSEVLENIAHTIRERQRILRQVQVETAEVRLSGYIIAVLPIFMLVVMLIISPAYASVLTQGFGQIILIGAGIWEVIGFLVIRRIVAIQV